MKKFIILMLAAGALWLAGCSTIRFATRTDAKKSAIESVFAQRAKLKAKEEPTGLLNDQRVAGLMAIDVQGCPANFRSAWFDYLVAVQSLHTRMDRVAMFASAEGKPVTDLPELIKFAANPTLGQYLLGALNKDDEAWEKVERSAMDYGVMPVH